MHDYIRKTVKQLMKRHGTNDPYILTEQLGILLVEKPLGSLAGSYRLMNRKKVIFINATLCEYHKKVVLAHELGHAILHPKLNCCFIRNKTLLLTSKVEREANVFACELLIEDDLFGEYIGYSLQEIAMAEYLPAELLTLKFNRQEPTGV